MLRPLVFCAALFFTAAVMAQAYTGPSCAQLQGLELSTTNIDKAMTDAKALLASGVEIAPADKWNLCLKLALAGSPFHVAIADRQFWMQKLRDIANADQTADAAGHRGITFEIEAQIYIDHGKFADAKAVYQQAQAVATQLKDTIRLPLFVAGEAKMISRLGDFKGAIDRIRQFPQTTDYDVSVVLWTQRELYVEHADTAGLSAVCDEAISKIPFPGSLSYVELKFDLLTGAGQKDAALALLKKFPDTASLLVRQFALETTPEAKKAVVVRFFGCRAPALITASGFTLDEAAMVTNVIPANDACLLMFGDAQAVADNYKRFLRKETGRLNNEAVSAFAKQLSTGDGQKVLVVTQASKDLATAIGAGNSAHKDFWVPFFNGDFKTAAAVALGKAKDGGDDDYRFWIQMLSGAVRANDQCYNKRAIDVIRWVNGDLAENPVADLLAK